MCGDFGTIRFGMTEMGLLIGILRLSGSLRSSGDLATRPALLARGHLVSAVAPPGAFKGLACMASSRPLAPTHTSPLRSLRKAASRFDNYDLVTDPAFVPNTQRTGTTDLPPREPRSHRTGSLKTSDLLPRHTGYLHGVSLSAVLQMLHLERKSCVVEVSAHGWLGMLTLVNGELVDATAGDAIGEEAACLILGWGNPQTAILDAAETFRHTVQRPITQLIMDAARIVDESGMLNPANLPEFDREPGVRTSGDWQWLIESLALVGATNIQIVTPDSLPTERRHTGFLGDPSADLARGIRTWATLLGPDVTEVVATRSDHVVILAVLDIDRSEFVYAEAPGPETAELIRRSLRSIRR
jgi:hypothetical protein